MESVNVSQVVEFTERYAGRIAWTRLNCTTFCRWKEGSAVLLNVWCAKFIFDEQQTALSSTR